MVARFQSGPTKRHFSQYRQISGGGLFLSLQELLNLKCCNVAILQCCYLIKEDINYWEEDPYT